MNHSQRARAWRRLLGVAGPFASDLAIAAKGADPVTGTAPVLLGLAAVMALIFGFAWLVRRIGALPLTASSVIQVLGGVSMGPRERVVLLQVGDTQLLIGVAPGRVQTLHVLAHPILPHAGSGQTPEGFAARLSALLKARGTR